MLGRVWILKWYKKSFVIKSYLNKNVFLISLLIKYEMTLQHIGFLYKLGDTKGK